jgi:hypothetical protein
MKTNYFIIVKIEKRAIALPCRYRVVGPLAYLAGSGTGQVTGLACGGPSA